MEEIWISYDTIILDEKKYRKQPTGHGCKHPKPYTRTYVQLKLMKSGKEYQAEPETIKINWSFIFLITHCSLKFSLI